MAECYLQRLGGDMFEVRSAYLNDVCQNANALFALIEDGLEYEPGRTRKLNTTDLGWATEIVVIGELKSIEAAEQLKEKQVLHWRLDVVDLENVSQEVELGIARANRDTIKSNINGILSRAMV